MAKKGLHPEWFETKVFCDGKLVLEVGTTKKELLVDIWSGNHPFFVVPTSRTNFPSQNTFVSNHSVTEN